MVRFSQALTATTQSRANRRVESRLSRPGASRWSRRTMMAATTIHGAGSYRFRQTRAATAAFWVSVRR